MTPKQINAYNQKIKNRKDMFCTKCNKKYPNTTNVTCALCGNILIDYSDNIPKCPTCQSTDIRKIGTIERGVSVSLFGILSNKIGKTMCCNKCGYKW